MLVIAAVCTVAVALYGIVMDRRHVKKLVLRELEDNRNMYESREHLFNWSHPMPEKEPNCTENCTAKQSGAIDHKKDCLRAIAHYESAAHYAAYEAVASADAEPMTASDVASVIGYSTSHTRRLLNQLVSEGYIKEDSLKVPYTFRIPDLPDSLS
jgi:CRP-like cAMP-binding protein